MKLALRELATKYLMVWMPPRSGKSTLGSHYFPAWYMGHFPDHEVFLAAYGDDFASSWGRRARDTLEEHGPDLFGISVRQDSSAADRWQIRARRGVMHTAGIGGSITGKGAHLLGIEDPVKNSAEAASETIQEKHWDWWLSTSRTRIYPETVIVFICTRWNENDLAGRIYRQNPHLWTVLSLPAIAENPEPEAPEAYRRMPDPLGRKAGEPLWPERFPLTWLRQTEAELGPYFWSALFQQRPSARKGGLFERSWFSIIPTMPRHFRSVRFWDLAATKKRGSGDPDWTVGLHLALLADNTYVVMNVERFREQPGEVKGRIKNIAGQDGRRVRIYLEQEGGSSGKLIVREYVTHLPGYALRGLRSTGDKTLRADPVSAQAQVGNIKLLRGAWNDAFLSELESFPTGAHDDQVDAMSGAYQILSAPPTQLSGSIRDSRLRGRR